MNKHFFNLLIVAFVFLRLSLSVEAQTKDGSGGIVTATWTWDGVNTSTKATLSQDGVMSVSGLTLGSDLSVVAPQVIGTDSYNKVQPATSSVATNDDADAITLMLTPKSGLTFTPASLSFKAARFGTNGGKMDVIAVCGDSKDTLLQDVTPNRNSTDPSAYNLDISGLTSTYTSPLYVKVYIKGLANTKQFGFRDFVVTGNYTGTVINLPAYTFASKLGMDGAGKITVSPDGNSFDEGTSITLSATENFGYHFTNWTDASGKIVSTDNPYTFSIKENTDLTANFTKSNVYSLNLSLTNGARSNLVTISPEGNVVGGVHQYEEGTSVKLTALNNKILTFTGWEDKTTTAERTISMDGNKNITANYSAVDYIVGWDLYDDDPSSERAADYKSDTENAGLLSLHDDAGVTTSWLSRGHVRGAENGKWAARSWRPLTSKDFFEISFSTKGYTHVKVSNDLGDDYNTYSIYDEQVSLDGKNYTTVGTFSLPNHGWAGNQDIVLPDSCSGQDRVFVRWYPDYTSSLTGVTGDNDGVAVSEIFVTANVNTQESNTPPVLESTNPEDNGTDVTANGSIVLNFDKRVQAGSGKAVLDGETLTPIVSGKTVVYKYSGLKYNTAYSFTIDNAAIVDYYGNAYAGTVIHFSTMSRQQSQARLYDAVVAADGTGSYTSLQAAIDAAPADRTLPWLIFIKKGTYTGHFVIPANKPYIHLIGQGKAFVQVSDNRTSGSGQYGIADGATIDVESANNYFEGFDLINSWGVEKNDGPQALALASNGDKLIMNKMGLRSYQDTWYTGGTIDHRSYIADSWIEGAVDFFYGQGDVMITQDSINIVRTSGGYIVAPNHPAGTKWGYVFLNNVITAPGVPSETSIWLGRPWHASPKTVYINTKALVTIPATGWYPTMGGIPALWAEYNTMDGNGNPVDLSHRRTDYWYVDGTDTIRGKSSTAVLTAEQAAQYTVKNVCGSDDAWNPELVCEECDAPVVAYADAKLTWNAVPYAICYVITKGDHVIGFTKDTSYAISDNGDYKVQAADEYGGLSTAAKISVIDGILNVSTSKSGEKIKNVYTPDGKVVKHLQKGLNIIRYTDGNVKKLVN